MDARVERTASKVSEAVQALALEQGLDGVTHQAVAERAGVGRATLYRHWPDRDALLVEGFGHARFSPPPATGELRADLFGLLESLRAGLVDGPLARFVAALLERSFHHEPSAKLLDTLTAQGHHALERRLRQAVEVGELEVNVSLAVAQLGGAVFYRALIRRERLSPRFIGQLVDDFLTRARG
jgi:AcrR family transcriptional regulator